MKLKFYTLLSILLFLIVPLYFEDANASHYKVIKGELTAASKKWPFLSFGGEQVGLFKMRFVSDRLNLLKIEMKDPPSTGYQYIVGFLDKTIMMLKSNEENPFGVLYSYSSNGRVIVLKDVPSIHYVPDFLLVNENNYSQNIHGKEIGSAPLPDPTNLNAEPTTFEHDGVIILYRVDLKRTQYSIGERIEIEPKLINMGNETISLETTYLPFIVNVYDSKGRPAWLFSCGIPDIAKIAILEPRIPWGYIEAYGSQLDRTIQNCYDITLDKPGEYVIVSHSSFQSVRKVGSDNEQPVYMHSVVYSKPMTIVVVQ